MIPPHSTSERMALAQTSRFTLFFLMKKAEVLQLFEVFLSYTVIPSPRVYSHYFNNFFFSIFHTLYQVSLSLKT